MESFQSLLVSLMAGVAAHQLMVSSIGSVVLISWASLGAASEVAVDSAVVLSAVLAASLEAAALLAAVPQPASRVAAMAAATPREIAFFMFLSS